MKKYIILIVALVLAGSLNAQEQQYTRKLDSVVGSDNFGWTPWKKVYAYQDSLIVETSYDKEGSSWVPATKMEIVDNQKVSYQWIEETWEATDMTTYEYDDLGRLALVMIYNGHDTLGDWLVRSKYEYVYNSEGLVDTSLYFTVRNGSFRESGRTIYSYNENRQCISLSTQSKGGMGPFSNNWRDSYRYDYEYDNDVLVTELYYESSWFGGEEMTLENKTDYEFDANGNLLRKTVSIDNGTDWVVRDTYENQFDLTVEAAKVLGLEQFWETTLNGGMGPAFIGNMPLNNLWLSCAIASSQLDTRFQLFCSGFDGVDEFDLSGFNAYGVAGGLVVESNDACDILVYDLLGRVVASESQTIRCGFKLHPGLYIVSDGRLVTKVVVR